MAVNYAALSIAFSIVDGLAVILTLFRLGFRLKIQRFWWEDVWAAIASLCTVVSTTFALIVSNGVITDHHESIVVASRINEYLLTSIIWSVRMSLIFSIIRITCAAFLRHIELAVSACFILFWVATCCLQSWWHTCDTKPLFRRTCVVPTPIIIFEVMTNVVADVATLILSLKLLWRVKLPRRQCRMILYLFTSSRFLCVFSLAHCISQLVGSQGMQEILAHVQVTAFMVVCNLVVVVTYIYRVFWGSSDVDPSTESGSASDDDDFTTPSFRRTLSLTTVNLDSALTGLTGTASDIGSGFYHSTTHTTREESQSRRPGHRCDGDLELAFHTSLL